MKTDEELIKIIHDNEYFLPFESNAYIVSVNKKDDEVEMGLNVLMASPMVGENGEIRNPHARTSRYGLMFRLKLSDLFQLAGGQAPPIRDINYTMTKLEEALNRIDTLQDALPRCHVCKVRVGQEHELWCSVEPGEYTAGAAKVLVDSRARHLCAHATGKHDEECDLVSGLSADLKDAREEVLDLFAAHCPAIAVGPDVRYDTMSSRTYEYTQELLIQWGLLKPEQCLRRATPLETKPSELGPDYVKVELPFPVKQISIDLLKDAEVKIPVDPAPVTPEWADEEKKDA